VRTAKQAGMVVKGGLSADLASSVAELAAIAAKERPAGRSPRNTSKEKEEKASNAKVRHNKGARKGEETHGMKEEENGAMTTTHADQTQVLVSGLTGETKAEDLEDAFR
jgi:hypothetical protein